MKYILALDQGTTSSRAVLFDEKGAPVASHGIEFPQLYPKPGWVEHRPEDILKSQVEAARAAVEKSGVRVSEIEAVGITSQRETTLLWERETQKPLYNAIVWQCRRTAPLIERLKRDGLGNVVRDRTGLIPDAYFSGTKLQWLLDTVPNARVRAERGELCFGTVDSFLANRLCAGHPHVTDATNAARTMLYNIYEHRWDEVLLRAMDIRSRCCPGWWTPPAWSACSTSACLGGRSPWRRWWATSRRRSLAMDALPRACRKALTAPVAFC